MGMCSRGKKGEEEEEGRVTRVVFAGEEGGRGRGEGT